jgi:hypothetical protein
LARNYQKRESYGPSHSYSTKPILWGYGYRFGVQNVIPIVGIEDVETQLDFRNGINAVVECINLKEGKLV